MGKILEQPKLSVRGQRISLDGMESTLQPRPEENSNDSHEDARKRINGPRYGEQKIFKLPITDNSVVIVEQAVHDFYDSHVPTEDYWAGLGWGEEGLETRILLMHAIENYRRRSNHPLWPAPGPAP